MGAAFERVIALSLRQLTPEAAKAKHIAIARAGLAAWIARQPSKPDVEIIVDGRPATSEDAVKPFGVITYRFGRIRAACTFALAEAQRLSPVGTDKHAGRYRKSWFFIADGKTVAAADQIPADAKVVILTNDQPYSRKINVGAKGFTAYGPPGVVEKVRVLTRQRFGKALDLRTDFITLKGGHVLAAPIKRGRHTQHELTYPSLIMTRKIFG